MLVCWLAALPPRRDFLTGQCGNRQEFTLKVE
jgi:hypothetical protein